MQSAIDFVELNEDLLTDQEISEFGKRRSTDLNWGKIWTGHPPEFVGFVESLVDQIYKRKKEGFYRGLYSRMDSAGPGDLFPQTDRQYFESVLKCVKSRSWKPLRDYWDRPSGALKEFESRFDPEKFLSFEDRNQIAELLTLSGEYKKAFRFAGCQKHAVKVQCKNDRCEPMPRALFFQPLKCELRICPVCGFFHAKKVIPRIKKMVLNKLDFSSKRRLMLLTLTKKKSPEVLRERVPGFMGNDQVDVEVVSQIRKFGITPEGIKEFFVCVRKFINLFYSKKEKQGAIGVLEVGPSGNLHCHLLVYGNYYPKADLKQEWYRITGDSYILDVKEIKDVNKGVGEVSKYIYKPPTYFELMDYVDYLLAISGVRRIHTFGIFYNFSSDVPAEPKEKQVCPYCGWTLEWIGMELGGWEWKGRPQSVSEAYRRKRSDVSKFFEAEVCLN